MRVNDTNPESLWTRLPMYGHVFDRDEIATTY
jgi:hypothetical protein